MRYARETFAKAARKVATWMNFRLHISPRYWYRSRECVLSSRIRFLLACNCAGFITGCVVALEGWLQVVPGKSIYACTCVFGWIYEHLPCRFSSWRRVRALQFRREQRRSIAQQRYFSLRCDEARVNIALFRFCFFRRKRFVKKIYISETCDDI